MASGSDYHYLPRHGRWRRRKGTTQKFDTFGSAIGQLSAKFSSKCRDFQEFVSDAVTDGIPTLCALATKETMTSGSVLDDGRFAVYYVRDQVNSLNYTLGEDYSATTYPIPGSVQPYKLIPLWHGSGDGGISRGVTEFQRRFLAGPGARRTLKVGNWRYSPGGPYGTPSRWRETFTAAAAQLTYGTPSAATLTSGTSWSASAGTLLTCLNDRDTDPTGTDYARWTASVGNFTGRIDFPVMSDPGAGARFGFRVLLRASAGCQTRLVFTIGYDLGGITVTAGIAYGGESNVDHSAANDQGNVTTAFTGGSGTNGEYSFTMSDADSATMRTGIIAGKQPFISVTNSGNVGTETFDIGYSALVVGAVSSVQSNRMMPSGPLPPTHAGSLAKGNNITSTTTIRPESDTGTDGTWTDQAGGTSLFAAIDESTPDDTDYIKSGLGSNTDGRVNLQDLNLTPVAGDTVKLTYRAKRLIVGGTGVDLNVDLYMGGTKIIGDQQTLASGFAAYTVTLTDAQIAAATAVDATWNTLSVRFITTGADAFEFVTVSYFAMTHRPAGAADGGWRGSDRFLHGCAYRAWDDSIWMPTIPRVPNSLLANGFNMFTVDSANPADQFDKLVWSGIPQPWYDMKSILLLRSDKIDSTTTDNLALNPLGLRIVAEVGIGTTTYDDYKADDDALIVDAPEWLIRWDHIMPPRARYIFGGDMRVCHSYGGLNPCAIIIAPVGFTADYDLNVADTSSTAYAAAHTMYMRLAIDSAGVATLILVKANYTGDSITTTKTFTLGTVAAPTAAYNTLEKLVDAINGTSCAVDLQQWRAQLCPGVDAQAVPAAVLCPHIRAIDTCTIAGQVITKTAGGLAKVAVGDWISSSAGGSGSGTGAYVSQITSDTSLTFVGVLTPGAANISFFKELGDAPTAATAHTGYQRVIANSFPGFLYFNSTYLVQFPIEKSSVWMTVATPGSVRSAPNCFRGNLELTNKFTPPTDAGISLGGVAVRNGFIVPFSKKRCKIVNAMSDNYGTGEDKDYKIIVYNEFSGCSSWASVTSGTDFAILAAPEGIIAADLMQELLLSEATWTHPASDAVLGVGDFDIEMPLSVAATAADTDNAYLSCKIARGILWVSYRKVSSTHPDRLVAYDFSSGQAQSGLGALLRDVPLRDAEGRTIASAGTLYGWGEPETRGTAAAPGFSQVTGGLRSDGAHLYGWNDLNAGSTGDGRIDEFATGDTDNGTVISASLNTPQLKHDGEIAMQELIDEHSSPAGATVASSVTRVTSAGETTYTPTAPSTSSTLTVSRDLRLLPLLARVPATACYLTWSQTAGPAGELRKRTLKAKMLRRLKTT
jgi:hypothetical protein